MTSATGRSAGGEVTVRTAGGDEYPVHIGPGVIQELPKLLRARAPAFRHALIGDDRVLALHGDRVAGILDDAGLSVDLHPFPAGESHKSREEWLRLTDALLASGLGRDGCVLALGGGVSGDLAGFVAATYLRGVPVVQLPTSLVAMVDSAVGGKTGVDVPAGKNLVGAFHPPAFVLADTDFIRTLPRAERRQGLAEVVKHGAILDAHYLDSVQEAAPDLLEGDAEATARAVLRSVELKAGVVSRDEREGGLREILNFGHTVGHGLELLTRYEMPHGTAVGLGMLLEARIGEALGVTASGTVDRLREALVDVELPVRLPAGITLGDLPEVRLTDKKVRQGQLRMVLLDRIGEVRRRPSGEGESGGGDWSHTLEIGWLSEFLEGIDRAEI
jgi:3-dehydroquinate synthase